MNTKKGAPLSMGLSTGPTAKGNWRAYWQLMRLDKPVGSLLLLWPTWWALWIAAEGIPSTANLIIFTLGVLIMRSAGCVINDIADRNVDRHVQRTANRPLAQGALPLKNAWCLFAALLVLALALVLMTSKLVIQLSFVGLLLASIYPFMKRYTHYPQCVLGAAFSWGIPMAYAAEADALNPIIGLFFMANLLWTIGYDTLYAMADKEDDLKIGVKSTAIAFGKYDWLISTLLMLAALILLVTSGHLLGLSAPYWLGLTAATLWASTLLYQSKNRAPMACFLAFKRMHWAGAFLWLGLFFSYMP